VTASAERWELIWRACEESVARLLAGDDERPVDELAARRRRVVAVESEDEPEEGDRERRR
jgi:hypothetical protein